MAGDRAVDGLSGPLPSVDWEGFIESPKVTSDPPGDNPSSAVPDDPVENPVEESPKTWERPSPNLSERAVYQGFRWWRGQDLNLRPSGYEPDELPNCSTPRRARQHSRPASRQASRKVRPRKPSAERDADGLNDETERSAPSRQGAP